MKKFFWGFCIGATDLVPGISGGTTALLLGIYDELIASICRFRLRFLLPILIGMGTAILSLSPLLHKILSSERGKSALYLLFLGLVAGSVKVCLGRYPAKTKREKGCFALGAAAAAFFVLFNAPTLFADAGPAYFYFHPWMAAAGSLAVAAMLLPGISGSYLMAATGAYPLLIQSLTFKSAGAVPILFSFGIGVAAGGILFTPLIRWSLQKFHGPAHTFLIGAMLGAMPALFTSWELLFLPLPLIGYWFVVFLEKKSSEPVYVYLCKSNVHILEKN